MTTAFDDAIEAAFDDDNIGLDALWRPGGAGDGIAVRVILKKPQAIVGVQDARFKLNGVLVDVRFSEVAVPAKGDTVELTDDGAVYAITQLADADSQRIVQTCEARPR